jgi:hypothetical protein
VVTATPAAAAVSPVKPAVLNRKLITPPVAPKTVPPQLPAATRPLPVQPKVAKPEQPPIKMVKTVTAVPTKLPETAATQVNRLLNHYLITLLYFHGYFYHRYESYRSAFFGIV